MSSPAVQLDVRPDEIAVLTVDVPGSTVNLLTADVWKALWATIDPLATRTGLKGLIVTGGKPGGFVAGADLKMLAEVGPDDPTVQSLIAAGHRALDRLEDLPFPTAAAIDGPALGGGLELALACDYRLGGDNPAIELGLPEVLYGLIPGWGGTQRLPRVIGAGAASHLLLTGDPVDRPRAVQAGLLDGTAPSASLLDATATYLLERPGVPPIRAAKKNRLDLDKHSTARMPTPTAPVAVREAYRVMIRGINLPLSAALPIETKAFLRLAGSEESKQRIAEFFANRGK